MTLAVGDGHAPLADYLLGPISDADAADVEEHLARCGRCARELERLVAVAALLAELGTFGSRCDAAGPRSADARRSGPA